MSAKRKIDGKSKEMNRKRANHHRGRRKSRKARRKNMILNVILVAAIVVFCVSAAQRERANAFRDSRQQSKAKRSDNWGDLAAVYQREHLFLIVNTPLGM